MYELRVQVGPAAFRIGSRWRQPIKQLAALYTGYPTPAVPDFTVRLDAPSLLRRYVRRSVAIDGDFMLPDAVPLPFGQALLAAEMGMNLQMALGWRRHLILHASAVERGGRVLIMTGLSGSGKSTLSALLGRRGWRFMGDEFVLIEPSSGAAVPFPRLISLKNEAIAAMQSAAPDARFGPLMAATPKGDITHMVPPADAIARMDEAAMPALLLFPRFGYDAAIRDVAPGETFMRMTQASTNYVALGETGFRTMTRFIKSVPARAIDYRSGKEALTLVEQLWAQLA